MLFLFLFFLLFFSSSFLYPPLLWSDLREWEIFSPQPLPLGPARDAALAVPHLPTSCSGLRRPTSGTSQATKPELGCHCRSPRPPQMEKPLSLQPGAKTRGPRAGRKLGSSPDASTPQSRGERGAERLLPGGRRALSCRLLSFEGLHLVLTVRLPGSGLPTFGSPQIRRLVAAGPAKGQRKRCENPRGISAVLDLVACLA